ncbi:hypothetical protein B0H14DRAFT_2730896 [Mycena olivaceomarginata]|nr:hypothetical protein B0H14DRAFT_2730896 [Mycena olivaceomarginata]
MLSVPTPSLSSTPSTTTRASADVGAVRARNPPARRLRVRRLWHPCTLHPPPPRPDRHAPARRAFHSRKASTPSPSPFSAPSSARTPPSPRLDRHAPSPASSHLRGRPWDVVGLDCMHMQSTLARGQKRSRIPDATCYSSSHHHGPLLTPASFHLKDKDTAAQRTTQS